MILVGNPRGGGKNLALHLLKDENDHVTVHEIRGFASQNVMGAFNEAYALSRATRCRQYLFSLSLNPPPNENVDTQSFENAIELIEGKLGLTGQPRVVIRHEKNARIHFHSVWSRINAETMKGIPLPFSKRRMMDVARELYREHGWEMPPGLKNHQDRDPRSYSLADWQQAKRIGKDPRSIKAGIQEAWQGSDCAASFSHALNAKGFWLARGDRRGFVVLDAHGEVYSLSRQAGVKAKALKERLGAPENQPGVDAVKSKIGREMLPKLKGFQGELRDQEKSRKASFERLRLKIVARQKQERQALEARLEKRRVKQAAARQARFRQGIGGLWDRLRGQNKRIQKRNEREAYGALIRERAEKDALVFQHLEQRRAIALERREERTKYIEQRQDLRRERFKYQEMKAPERSGEDQRRAYVKQKQMRTRTGRKIGPTPER